MVDGRQMQRTFRGTEAAARKELKGWMPEEVDELPVAVDNGRTFGDLLTKWLAHITKRGRTPKTIDEARREIETRIRPRLGDIPITDLGAEDLDSAYSEWLSEGLASSSVHRHAAVISAALTQGVKWGWLDTSPATKATAPTAKSDRKLVTPSKEQVGKLIRAAESDDPMMAAAVAIAFVTGCRRGELCALRWSDVDFKMMEIESGDPGEIAIVRIGRSLSQVGDSLVEKATKTGRERAVMVDQGSAALLRRHQAWQHELSARAESPLVANPYVLSNNANAGRPVRPSVITDRFMALRTEAKVLGVRFHDLRHATATQMLAAGVDPATVSKVLGHASTKMTLDVYASALPAGAVKAASVMGALLPA